MKKRMRAFVGLALVAALGLSACSSGGSGSNSTSDNSSKEPAAENKGGDSAGTEDGKVRIKRKVTGADPPMLTESFVICKMKSNLQR